MPAFSIIIAVTNDLVMDQRAHKVAMTYVKKGYQVTLVGRRKKASLPVSVRDYSTHRMEFSVESGPLFYVLYMWSLYQFLKRVKPTHVWSCDLDSLWPCYRYSRKYAADLVYDSHECFTEVPELIRRPFKRSVWMRLEKSIFPKLKHVVTVSTSIAAYYKQKYQVEVKVLRNLPVLQQKQWMKVNLPIDVLGKKVLVYQGAVNEGRGIELMVDMMVHLKDAVLLIIGAGDVFNEIEARIIKKDLCSKVFMIGLIPFEELGCYTRLADLGLSFEEDKGSSYRWALPNKIFDYIHAGVPVLCSDLSEMRQLIERYSVGEVLLDRSPLAVARQVEMLLKSNKRDGYIESTVKAKKQLCWQEEIKGLRF